jgi:hypothetical protein
MLKPKVLFKLKLDLNGQQQVINFKEGDKMEDVAAQFCEENNVEMQAEVLRSLWESYLSLECK